MSLKFLFKELYAHLDDSTEDFQKIQAFSELSKQPEIVKQVEPFLLPEVTKLICCSSELMQLDFTSKYQFVQPLYDGSITKQEDVVSHLDRYIKIKPEILEYIDSKILDLLENFHLSVESQNEQLRKKISAQRGQLTKYRKTGNPDSMTIISIERTIEELAKEREKIKCFLDNYKKLFEEIKRYKKKGNDDIENRRKNAYSLLDRIERAQTFKKILNELSVDGELIPSTANCFKDREFLASFLLFLSREENKRFAIPVLLKLFDSGTIDINEPPVFDFVAEKPDLLIDYLLGRVPEKENDLESEDLNTLVDIALRLEFERKEKTSHCIFYQFWNQLIFDFDWIWIFRKIESFYPENFDEVVGCLLSELRGKASKSCVNILFDPDILGRKVSAADIFAYAMSSSEYYGNESVINAFRVFEKNNQSMRRKLNFSERKLRSESQDIFSSMYVPLEELESLAVNLSFTSRDIKASLVGKHLRDIVAELRDALGRTCRVMAVADIDDWKNLEKIHFDAAHHKFSGIAKQPPREVLVKTLGFSYMDDEGMQKEYPAQVIEAPSSQIKKYSKRTGAATKKSLTKVHLTKHPTSEAETAKRALKSTKKNNHKVSK